MEYDPIKNKLGRFFLKRPKLQILFYKLLDKLLLRTWHVHSEVQKWAQKQTGQHTVLDAGTGFGQYSYWMASTFPHWQVQGVEINPDQVKAANEFFRKVGLGPSVQIETGDLTQWQRPESFDLSVCVDVMEHILEDVEVFRNIHASLRPGGMLLISTPSDQGGSDVSEDSDESFIGEHVRDGYNIREIEEKLRTAGFSRVEARYAYGRPGQISWRLSMKYPMQMLNATFLSIIFLPFYYLVTYPISYIFNWLDVKMPHSSGTGLIVKAWK